MFRETLISKIESFPLIFTFKLDPVYERSGNNYFIDLSVEIKNLDRVWNTSLHIFMFDNGILIVIDNKGVSSEINTIEDLYIYLTNKAFTAYNRTYSIARSFNFHFDHNRSKRDQWIANLFGEIKSSLQKGTTKIELSKCI